MHHKTGQLVTQNRQHIKPTQISVEQYLWDQLHKHAKTDPLKSILTQLEKQPDTSNNNNINNGPFINNPTHEHSTSYNELENNYRKREENNEHKISKNRISVSRNIDHKDMNHDSAIRTRYGRVI